MAFFNRLLADLDGDGRDEVLGATVFSPDGKLLAQAEPFREARQMACAKERHRSGDVCLFEPITGRFVQRFSEKADRLYVADVTGDWREEVIVLNGNELHVYENRTANPRPDAMRLWEDRNYRRLKQCHNYYSP